MAIGRAKLPAARKIDSAYEGSSRMKAGGLVVCVMLAPASSPDFSGCLGEIICKRHTSRIFVPARGRPLPTGDSTAAAMLAKANSVAFLLSPRGDASAANMGCRKRKSRAVPGFRRREGATSVLGL